VLKKIEGNMKNKILICILLFTIQTIFALEFNSIIISTNWLEENIDEPELLIYHIGDNYAEEHIPNAHNLQLDRLCDYNRNGLDYEMPEVQDLQQYLSEMGVTQDSKIVLYYENEAYISDAARIYVTLDYAGLSDNVAVLNGGLAKWKNEEKKTTQIVPDNVSGDIEVVLNERIIVDSDWILKMMNESYFYLVDARPMSLYDGTEENTDFVRNGHILYALNIPFYEVQKDEPVYELKDDFDLEQLFINNNIEPGSIIVTYCNTGYWASVIYLAAKAVNYEVYLYDASFQEWNRDESLPVMQPVEYEK